MVNVARTHTIAFSYNEEMVEACDTLLNTWLNADEVSVKVRRAQNYRNQSP